VWADVICPGFVRPPLVDLRRDFTQENALKVANLDVWRRVDNKLPPHLSLESSRAHRSSGLLDAVRKPVELAGRLCHGGGQQERNAPRRQGSMTASAFLSRRWKATMAPSSRSRSTKPSEPSDVAAGPITAQPDACNMSERVAAVV
jgi:hypothetical protein